MDERVDKFALFAFEPDIPDGGISDFQEFYSSIDDAVSDVDQRRVRYSEYARVIQYQVVRTSDWLVVKTGKSRLPSTNRSVSIGGSINGSTIIMGDRNA